MRLCSYKFTTILILLQTYATALFTTNPQDSDQPGFIFTLDDRSDSGIAYYADHQPYLLVTTSYPSLASDWSAANTGILTTSIHAKSSIISKAFLESQIALYRRIDEVWSDDFLMSLIISYEGPANAQFDDDANEWLETQDLVYLYLSDQIRAPTMINVKTKVFHISEAPPPGPYIIASSPSSQEKLVIHNVYRLYEDEYEAFVFGAIPDLLNGGWKSTNITLPSSYDKSVSAQFIPVPSRLPLLSSSLPLAGTRFGLKDIFDAQGLPTAAGSHAYQLAHPIPNITAPSISKLISMGANMVGKTRTSQFAHGANPWEFIDFSYSWNPRGDGYLTAAASSSGSACAIAAYEWLDFTVGSDTRGSVRKPAALVGAYGIRPTLGSLDLTGVVPLSEEMDTAGFFTRDPRLFHEIQRRWYADSPVASSKAFTSFPKKLLYPSDHFPVKNPTAQILYDSFISAMEYHLGIIPSIINMTSLLLSHFPNHNFAAFQLTSNKLAEYRSWKSVGEPIGDYFASHFHGSDDVLPKFDTIPQKMFARGRNISDFDFEDAVAVKHRFREAIAKHVIKPHSQTCSESIFVYDAAAGGLPSYRIEDFNSLHGAAPFLLTAPLTDSPMVADYFNFLASMAELPEITVPIGQVPYWSQVTRQWEMLPVAVQIVAARGCDTMLLDLVAALAAKGVIGSVKVGRTLF